MRACLRASGGQPDVAVDFLTGGIPPGAAEAAAAAREQASAPAPAASASDGRPLSALRNHPQFDALKRLVQNNPQMLQTVLAQIGQQQPDLLQEINDNQAAFLEMMNEPISASAPAPAAPPVAPAAPLAAGGGSAHVGPAAMLENLQNPAQMAQMLQAMSPQERQAMAGIMGLSPEQLDQTAQMIAQMPQDQFQAYMQMAMSQGGGMGGMGGGGGGGGQPVTLRLTEEEMAAVDRLTSMGFDRSEAAQAYLACDKNETLAANLLMDGGFGFMDDGGAGGAGGGAGDDNGDDMYD